MQVNSQCGVPNMTLSHLEESMQFLLEGSLDFEFRTTVMDELHDEAGFAAIGAWLQSLSDHKAPRFFLQPYVDRESVLVGGFTAPNAEKLQKMSASIVPFVEQVAIRGQD